MKWLLLVALVLACLPAAARPERRGPFGRLVMGLVDLSFRLLPRLHHEDEPRTIDCTPPPASDRPVVLLLHGFYGRPTEFFLLKPALEARLAGCADVAVVTPLDPQMGDDPTDVVGQVAAYIEAGGMQGRPLVLVGHSTGGVIARCCLTWAHDVRAVVGMGTPNGGVRKLDPVPVHWLRAQGFAARVNTPYPARADVPFLMIAGTRGGSPFEPRPNDGVVSRDSVCTLAGPNVTLREFPVDHWQLLRDPAVVDAVATFIATVLTPPPPPAPPTPRPSDEAP
jgi:pimeloyl-ACP methyl ester carboxylesterase